MSEGRKRGVAAAAIDERERLEHVSEVPLVQSIGQRGARLAFRLD
jgi:hypothetical protein